MDRLTQLVLRFPRTSWLVILGLTALLAGGLPKVRTEFGYRVLLGDEHPSIQALEGMIEEFGGGLPIQIAWLCGDGHPCASVFDSSSLLMAHAVTEALAPVQGVRLVEGLPNAPLLTPTSDGFAIRRLVEDGEPAADAPELAARAVDDPFWLNLLVSADARIGVIVVQTTDTKNDTEKRVVRSIQQALAPFQAQGFTYHVVGDSYSAVVSGGELARSMTRVVPLTVLAIALILLALTRSITDALAALITTGFGLLWTFGLLGWLGWPRDAILEVLPSLVLAIGACDTVHLLARYRSELTPGGATLPALMRAARDVGRPCLITTLTTAGALLSFCTSSLQTFIRFGVLSAFGVIACLLLTFSLLPLMLRASPWTRNVRLQRVTTIWNGALGALLRVTEARSPWILGVSALLLVACGIGWMNRLQVDTYWHELIGEKSDAVRSIRFLEDHLRPAASLEIQVGLPAGARIEEPETLERLDRLQTRLAQVPGLGTARSVVDFVSRTNRLLHEDSPAWDRPAETMAGNAEILDLIAFTDGKLLERWTSFDRSKARVSVEASISPNRERERILSEVAAILDEELPPGWSTVLSGPLAMNHDWTRDIQQTQLRSFPAALVVIVVMVALFLGSIRLALAAMVPTVLPVIVTLGAMGWLGVSLDVGRAMIAAVLLGVAVDDSVYLLTQYKRQRLRGQPPRQAMGQAVLHVGRAVVTTSLALSLGFLTLMASAWQTVSSFGFFVALAILGALAADLLVLPALVFAFAPGRGAHAAEERRSRGTWVGRPNVRLLVIGAIAPPLLALGLAATSLTRPGSSPEMACWVLPNNRVALFPGLAEDCPLRAHESVDAAEVTGVGLVTIDEFGELQALVSRSTSSLKVAVTRQGRREWHEVGIHPLTWNQRALRWVSAFLAVCALLALPVVLLARSRSRAAAPFAFLYSALGVVLVMLIADRTSVWLNRMALLASAFAPAILSHLSLAFPRERRVLRESPGIRFAPYGLSAIVCAAAWLAMERNALLWPTVVHLLLFLSLGAWSVLLLSCWFAVRESQSPLERNRAKILLFGALLLPLLPAPLLYRFGTGAPAILAFYLGVSILLIPFPIGLAISRYNLLNLNEDVRFWIARLVYYAAAALAVTLIVEASLSISGEDHPLRQPAIMLGLALVAVATVEIVRGRVLGWVEGVFSPRLERFRRLGSEYGRDIDELRDEDHVAKLLGETVEAALGSRSGCVFLAQDTEWRPTYAFGMDPPAQLALAWKALDAVRTQRVAQIADISEGPRVPWALELHGAGVELVAKLERAGEIHGLLLLSPSRSASPYTRLDIEFVATAAHRAAVALHNARIATELVASERRATTGRTALALAHDVGKELGLIRTLARRLPERLADPERAKRDLGLISELAEDLLATVRGFVGDATRPQSPGKGLAPLDVLLTRADRTLSRIHGPDRITQSVPGDLRRVEVRESLERVLQNLLDNALLASPPADPVHLFATRERDLLRITISDRGCGMTERERNEAFRLGFTTRRPGNGSGVGLAVSREIVHALGGSIELAPNPGGGTIATARVPLSSGHP